jgi:hypothetical protein
MPKLNNVSAPSTFVHTDTSGTNAAGVSTAPPVDGTDYGLQVYANLGSEVVAVSQELQGAANFATGQVALNASSATVILAARATRRSSLVTNSSASIVIYVGPAGVTTSTGQPIAAGASLTIPSTAAVYGIAASSTPTAAYSEAHD